MNHRAELACPGQRPEPDCPHSQTSARRVFDLSAIPAALLQLHVILGRELSGVVKFGQCLVSEGETAL